jgi:hypothetical protein
MSELEAKNPKPKWWIPYWLIQIVLAVIFWVAGYLYLSFPLEVTLIGLFLTFGFIGVVYNIRVKRLKWLKPYWMVQMVSVVAFGAASYLFLNVSLERAVMATIFTLLAVCFGYYIRVRPNVKINRVMYIA